ncbi:MAG: 2-amino-4-hydroxy-6-hydroxymethyldihydropteridine diphosphokinase [Proteobacteria bacterium]|nr:2-amino-4-hydroxy-6-hydroxymethyldihydropteridine diphosphokinase [Pseudomonadota bacterium]
MGTGNRRRQEAAMGTGTVAAYVSLGSNLGHRSAHLTAAVTALRALPDVEIDAASRVYETDPVGPPPQERYLNAALRVRTSLPPRRLLRALLEIERARGRRRAGRDGPRTLDLDLLLYGDRVIDEPGLRVPHPLLHERAFVLEPLCEIAGSVLHPVLGERVEDLARKMRDPQAVRLWTEEEIWPSSP